MVDSRSVVENIQDQSMTSFCAKKAKKLLKTTEIPSKRYKSLLKEAPNSLQWHNTSTNEKTMTVTD